MNVNVKLKIDCSLISNHDTTLIQLTEHLKSVGEDPTKILGIVSSLTAGKTVIVRRTNKNERLIVKEIK